MINYSFIIPHKNCPDLLQRCVDSIPERDDVQIIVVDDNSNEGKKPQISRKGVEVILLDAECSKGAGRARNVGLEHAKGKWLLFPDSDDYYKKGFLEILDKYATQDVDVLYFNFEFKDGKTGENLTPLGFQKYFMDYDGSREARTQIKFRHNVPWTKMVLHKYVKEHQLHFEEVPNGNDILFSMMVGFNTDSIAVEKQILYVYLRNENSILTKKLTKELGVCKLTHLVQQNYFYNFINHPEWKRSIIACVLHLTKAIGLQFVITLFLNMRYINIHKKDWVLP